MAISLRTLVTVFFMTAAAAGCTWLSEDDEDEPRYVDTGIRGVVLRGPIEPVCEVDVPCEDEPFAADFAVLLGGRPVASFRSAADGTFEVPLAPGDYRIVPGADAPILEPASQAKDVSVRAGAFTEVELHFDTGIR